ncbi:hypothetical protein GWI33_017387 [Rhynchophorus ferrugineus]|uniref:Uncharacterized protein n=1 Tax=Rhynchophorus ferrugineus TaxID=354439 RepID=A0A834MIL1_RHYFE|nr:hypothetical protein GWI33_017387 [Rhynchophorus ferrugineus]
MCPLMVDGTKKNTSAGRRTLDYQIYFLPFTNLPRTSIQLGRKISPESLSARNDPDASNNNPVVSSGGRRGRELFLYPLKAGLENLPPRNPGALSSHPLDKSSRSVCLFSCPREVSVRVPAMSRA